MTIDEFLERLTQTPRGWKVDRHARLRFLAENGGYHCPISATTGDLNHKPDPERGGAILGLTWKDVWAIVDAADAPPYCDMGLRARLLKACGL